MIIKYHFHCNFHYFLECTSISFKNSWYIFSESGRKWERNRDFCRSKGGDLVSIETEQEWKFINKEIQNRSTTDGKHEWDIGLIKKDANWTWVSGIPLTICKWGNGEPNGDGDVGQILKEFPNGKQGLFNDLAGDAPKAFICEISKGKTELVYLSVIMCAMIFFNLADHISLSGLLS